MILGIRNDSVLSIRAERLSFFLHCALLLPLWLCNIYRLHITRVYTHKQSLEGEEKMIWFAWICVSPRGIAMFAICDKKSVRWISKALVNQIVIIPLLVPHLCRRREVPVGGSPSKKTSRLMYVACNWNVMYGVRNAFYFSGWLRFSPRD